MSQSTESSDNPSFARTAARTSSRVIGTFVRMKSSSRGRSFGSGDGFGLTASTIDRPSKSMPASSEGRPRVIFLSA